MTNIQLWLAIGVPSFFVLVGILLNQVGFTRVESRLTAIEADLRRFYQILGEHSKSINILEKKAGLS